MDNKNNKQVGGKKKIEAGGAIGAVGGIIFSNLIQPYIKEFVNAIVNKLDYQIKNSKDGKITIPDMCQPDFPLDVETVVSLLEDKKFITATVPLQLKDANSKYKDCINNQVVGTSPKQGKRVELESIIKVRYITQEVIDASIKIFEDEEKAKAEKKQEKKQKEVMDAVAVGDSILTTSGFYGMVIDVTDDTVIVEFGGNKNCRIPMQKSAIVDVEKAE